MSSFLNNDLRSEARAYQRDKNHNAKWARGGTVAPGRGCSHLDGVAACPDCATRPNHRDQDRLNGRNSGRLRQITQKKENGQAATLARKAFRNDVVDALDGPIAHVSDASSSEEEVVDASAAPIPADHDVLYSFDAPTGPHARNNILSHAVTKAVQRFESLETEKLVNREYDVIDEGKEGYNADADEEVYELIDMSHFK